MCYSKFSTCLRVLRYTCYFKLLFYSRKICLLFIRFSNVSNLGLQIGPATATSISIGSASLTSFSFQSDTSAFSKVASGLDITLGGLKLSHSTSSLVGEAGVTFNFDNSETHVLKGNQVTLGGSTTGVIIQNQALVQSHLSVGTGVLSSHILASSMMLIRTDATRKYLEITRMFTFSLSLCLSLSSFMLLQNFCLVLDILC